MGRYLVATNVLIDYSWHREPVLSLIGRMLAGQEEVGICAVQFAEIYSGQERGERSDLDRFLDAMPCWPITPGVDIAAGDDRRAFARIGRAIGTIDAIIAAVARSVGATIVTRNVRHYAMADVEVLVP